FDFIFVDEFQDTDRIQADILRSIATDASGNFVSGKIAVVGDPKQSIYAFRRADPETYAAFTRNILGSDTPRLLLDQYRSTPQLVDVLNRIGGPLFDGGDRDPNVFQPEYHPLHAARKGDSGVEPMIFIDGGEDPEKEAEAIAAWIESQGESDLRKFALLFRRRTRMETYLDVFDRRKLAYVVPPLGLFLETPAAVDLLSVLRAIAYGYDRGALISAARSPYFALTDSEVAAGILADEDGPWKQFIEAMRALRDSAKNLTVTATIDHVIATTGIEAVYDDRSRRHLEQVRAIAFTYDQKAGGSLRQFVEEIARRRETPEEVDASLLDDTTNAVRILTIHGAKGLEFDRVILPDIEFTTNSSGVDVFTVEEPRSLVLRNGLETLSGICRYSDNRQLKEIGSLRDKAETRRLFYVAITRAKSQVVIAVNPKKVTNNGFGRFINELFPNREVQKSGGQAILPVREDKTVCPPLAPCVIPTPEPIVEKLSLAEIKIARAGMANRAAGILLHRVLERWDGNSDVAPLVAALAIEQASDDRAVDLVRRRIAQIASSQTLRRILAAETIGREMPVAFIDETGTLVERRIDRLIRENGSDIVIDYKSGAPGEARIARDREQVALYCRLVGQMTGRPCAGLLWYIDVENDHAIMV
ncbi:MAG TPA: 3'-5' exonuclease, partial [Thermoanaerobaculia bacterium]|nr:3'-5' exonuclease [Thermoanaerobaculia bacterium]